MQPVLKQLFEKGVVTASDIYLILDPDLVIPQRLSKLTENQFNTMAS
jgi:hypothetical protein